MLVLRVGMLLIQGIESPAIECMIVCSIETLVMAISALKSC